MDRASDVVIPLAELIRRIHLNHEERKILVRAARIASDLHSENSPFSKARKADATMFGDHAAIKRIIGPTLIDGQATPESKGGAR